MRGYGFFGADWVPELDGLAGAGGVGRVCGAIPVLPLIAIVSCEPLLFAGRGLGMTDNQLRDEVWRALHRAECQVRYWEKYHFWINIIDVTQKVVLGVAGALSVCGVILNPAYDRFSAWIGSITGVIATWVLPAFRWHEKEPLLKKIYCDWVEVRDEFGAIWHELETEESTVLHQRFRETLAKRQMIAKIVTGLPNWAKWMREAEVQADMALGVQQS